MTLVIGRATNSQVILLSDTRQTDPRQTRGKQSVMTGTLKTTFLPGGVAIAFTGNIDIAQEAIRSLPSNGTQLSFRDTLNHLEACTRDNENEYLVGFAGPKRLFRVHAGQSEDRRKVWIGDLEGHERFEKGVMPVSGKDFWRITILGPQPDDTRLVNGMLAQFQDVLEDSAVPSVGDFFTLAVGQRGEFRFLLVVTAFVDGEGVIRAPDGSTILSSTGENRAYRFLTWVPRKPNFAAAAYVFPEIEQCYVFFPEASGFADQCCQFSGLSGEALADEIDRTLNIRFETLEFAHLGDPRVGNSNPFAIG
jgi:hypothetical protein